MTLSQAEVDLIIAQYREEHMAEIVAAPVPVLDQVVPLTSSEQRMHILDGTCWCAPIAADGLLTHKIEVEFTPGAWTAITPDERA